MSLQARLPSPEVIVKLKPEELGPYLLSYLRSLPANHEYLNRHNLFQNPNATLAEYPADTRERVSEALLEAWDWLVREGLLTRRVGAGHPDWVSISRRGSQLDTGLPPGGIRSSLALPSDLHPAIPESARSAFIRGDFPTAVFESFKEVEISVRLAGMYEQSEHGVELMRQAFNPVNGPLADYTAEMSEREAESHLFAGAIGRFKNPFSHRRPAVPTPSYAEDMIRLASLLLRIVDERRQSSLKVV